MEKQMQKLTVFNQVSLDGFICDRNGDMSWAHKNDAEWNEFVGGNAKSGGTLLFGRVTYDMMASFWPTPMAAETMPAVAKGMNEAAKIVVSRTMKKASWSNTRVVNTDLAGEVRRLKAEAGSQIAILGSGSIVGQLAAAGLIDEYQIAINPIVLGGGKSMFAGIEKMVSLKLVKSRTFKNGNVVLWYER
jgi:dihydrofolate reductase